MKSLWLSDLFCLGRNLSRSIKYFGCPRNPRAHTFHLRGNATCIAWYLPSLRGTSTEDYLCPVYFTKQVHILLCHPCNIHVISGGISACLLEETGVHPIMPPTQLMQHVKGNVLLMCNIIQNDESKECYWMVFAYFAFAYQTKAKKENSLSEKQN